MKIATYNIWNSESGMPYRIKYIVNEIKLINADVICLQEVSSRKLAESIAANAIYCSFFYNSQKIAVVNVHLPWDSVLSREHQIIKIVNAVDKKTYDYVYMAGDFNCSDFSDVQRFLLGECTAIYEDIALAASDHYGVVVEME